MGEKGTKIKYILGNHDYQIRKHKQYFVNFSNFEIILDSLVLGNYVFIHGHQFDLVLKRLVFLYPLISYIYPKIYKLSLRITNEKEWGQT